MQCMSVNTSIRLPVALKRALQARADQEGRSLNNLMVRILEGAVSPVEPVKTFSRPSTKLAASVDANKTRRVQ